MQVDWQTMKSHCRYQSDRHMDSLSARNRRESLLTQDFQNIPPEWKARLDRMLGTTEWKEAFYKKVTIEPGLFGQPAADAEMKHTTMANIGRFITQVEDDLPQCCAESEKSPEFV